MDPLLLSFEGERAWRNIQPIVRESFMGMGRLLQAQSRQLEALERKLQIQAAEMRQQLICEVDAKLTAAMDRLVNDVLQPTYATRDALKESNRQHEQVLLEKVETMESAAKLQQQQQNAQSAKQLADTVSCKMDLLRSEILADAMKAIAPALKDLEQQIANPTTPEGAANQEPPWDSMRLDLARLAQEVTALDLKASSQMSTWRQQLLVEINRKASADDVAHSINEKMDAAETQRLLATKVDMTQMESQAKLLTQRIEQMQEAVAANVAQVHQLTSAKANAVDIEKLDQNMSDLLSVVESLHGDVLVLRDRVDHKKNSSRYASDSKHVQSVLTDVQEMVNAQLKHVTVHTSSVENELERLAQQVQGVKRQLRSEIYQARYIWKTGRPSERQTISWSSQVVNTNNDIFGWKQGSDGVLLQIPGLYHVQASFFTSFAPTIQLLVNGEPALVLPGEDTIALSPGLVPTSHRMHHSAGNVVGLTVDAFLALPSRSLLSIAYDIDESAQGFLNVRKL